MKTSHKSQGTRHWSFLILTFNSLVLLVLLFCISKSSYSQSTPAIITDWMDYAGISDTLTVIPVVQDDSANIISVGVMMNDTTGPDILISKVDSVNLQHNVD